MKLLYVHAVLIVMIGLSPNCMLAENGQMRKLIEQGVSYYKQDRYPEAVDCYIKGMEMAKADKDMETYSQCLTRIGLVYIRMNDMDRAIYYFKKSYAIGKNLGNEEIQGENITQLVSAYCFKGEPEEAKRCFELQKRLKRVDEEEKRFFELFNGALIEQVTDNFTKAAELYEAAISFAQDNNMETRYVSSGYGLLVYVFLRLDRTDEALADCERYRSFAEKTKSRIALRTYYEIMRDVYIYVKDSGLAIHYLQLSDSLSEAIINQEQIDAVDNKVVQFENNIINRDIDILNNKVNRQLAFIICVSFLVLLMLCLIAVVMLKNRNLRKAQRILVKKNEEMIDAERRSRKLLERYMSQAENGIDGEKVAGIDAGRGGAKDNEMMLSQEQTDDLLNRISSVMEDIHIISRPDFDLGMLAQLAGSNTKYISSVINGVYKKNFKTFLNEYRIHEACRRMSDTEHYGNKTIQAIYSELGYSSASNFISAFRKINGMTPSTYQKLIREKATVTKDDDM